MKTTYKGISIKTACRAIKDSRDKADKALAEHQTLINQAVKQFEFDNYEEFRIYWILHPEMFG